MKAVVFHGLGDIRLDNVSAPRIRAGTDALVRITASAICGTDLHMVRGTMPGMKSGTVLGHEGVGVEEVGRDVHNLAPGDRVVIPSTIACGACSYCRAGYPSSATTPTRTGRSPGRRSSAGRRKPGASTGCRRSSPACRWPTPGWSSFPTR
jgi:threonine dehydrogenase-like Zn-dependent dehydrogenase